jgi:phosphoribosylglycinamide formyltransferase-1
MHQNNLKSLSLGIVASSGGATIINAYKIFNSVYPDRLNLIVATDRPCGIEEFCLANSISYRRFEQSDNAQLSQDIQDYFSKMGGIDAVLLFFLRLITKELFTTYPCLNTHPSLLPDFPSFNPLRQALKAGANEIGATMHMADDSIDGGDILMQVSYPIEAGLSEADAEKLSFCQKTYLTLVFIAALSQGKISFEQDVQKNFKFIGEEGLFKGTEDYLESLDPALNHAYQNEMSELSYQKWLI